MVQAPLTLRRWKRIEYARLVELGVFEGEPLELIGGQLVVEVADSSLCFDREHKGNLYARAGIREYWIVNLVDRVLEVYRDAGADARAIYGWRYRSVRALAPPAVIVPLAFTPGQIAVADLLP